MQLFYYEGFWVSSFWPNRAPVHIAQREKKRERESERVRLLSSLVPFVFSLGFVDDDKPLPEAKFHRLQSVNVEVGCCLLVPQYRTIFLWVFKVYWLKSQKILGWLIKYISSTLTLTFLLVLLLTCINCKKSTFFSNGNHHFLPNSDDAEEILQSIRFEIPAKTKSEIAVITAVVKASLKRWFDLH